MRRNWAVATFAALLICTFVSRPDARMNRLWPAPVGGAAGAAGDRLERYYIDAPAAGESEMVALRDRLIARGARHVNWFVPSLVIFEVPAGEDPANYVGDGRFAVRREAEMAPAVPGTLVDIAMRAYGMAAVLTDPRLPGPDELGFEDRVLEASAATKREWQARQAMVEVNGVTVRERDVNENNEFLVGKMLVRLVLPESAGPKENWTDEWLLSAIQGATQACLAMQQTYDYVPMSFTFDQRQRVPTSYEPIDHCSGCVLDDSAWITDVMRNLGIEERDHTLAVHVYNNEGRSRFGTDWAHTVFIANSRNEPGNIFAGSQGGAGYTAYAMLGGPFFVIPYPAGANDPNALGEQLLFSQIYQHEMVHIFWGLDEYPSAPSQCTSISGYLRIPNQNKQSVSPAGDVRGCPNYVPCIMWGARNPGRALCRWTTGQMGVSDLDEDGVVDVFDSPPIIEFEGAAIETVTTPDVTVNMKAISTAVPNLNPSYGPEGGIDYAAPLKDATADVNGVGNVKLTPLDGRWDEVEEDLRFALQGVTPGLTQIQVRARNSFGAESALFVKRLYFTAVQYAQFSFSVKPDGIDVQWRTVGETFDATMALYRIDPADGGRPVLIATDEQLEKSESGSFKTYRFFDGDVVPGQEYHYYVRGASTLGGAVEEFAELSRTFEVRAMLPMPSGWVSAASPNPFQESTSLSVAVPKSFAENRNNTTTFQTLVPTEVEITVFDVLGRPVATVFRGRMFGRIETFRWDGKNARGEQVASGIYFVRTNAGPLSDVKKVVVVR